MKINENGRWEEEMREGELRFKAYRIVDRDEYRLQVRVFSQWDKRFVWVDVPTNVDLFNGNPPNNVDWD